MSDKFIIALLFLFCTFGMFYGTMPTLWAIPMTITAVLFIFKKENEKCQRDF